MSERVMAFAAVFYVVCVNAALIATKWDGSCSNIVDAIFQFIALVIIGRLIWRGAAHD